MSIDRLIDALWGEQPPRTAATSLQNFVSQLRKTLGAGRTRDEAARLPSAPFDPGRLDLDRFRHLVEKARATPDAAERSRT